MLNIYDNRSKYWSELFNSTKPNPLLWSYRFAYLFKIHLVYSICFYSIPHIAARIFANNFNEVICLIITLVYLGAFHLFQGFGFWGQSVGGFSSNYFAYSSFIKYDNRNEKLILLLSYGFNFYTLICTYFFYHLSIKPTLINDYWRDNLNISNDYFGAFSLCVVGIFINATIKFYFLNTTYLLTNKYARYYKSPIGLFAGILLWVVIIYYIRSFLGFKDNIDQWLHAKMQLDPGAVAVCPTQ
jgi:hypothetical protein